MLQGFLRMLTGCNLNVPKMVCGLIKDQGFMMHFFKGAVKMLLVEGYLEEDLWTLRIFIKDTSGMHLE